MPHLALWVNADKKQEVKTVEGNHSPKENEMLLRCICVGVNPADWKHSEVFGATDTIEGLDAVGQVVELGPGVTGFHVGQVVLTIGRGIGAPCYGCNQEYFLAGVGTSWAFDETKLRKEEAATIPLTMCVACDGLYLKMDPPLSLPWEESKTGSPILLWGGATQVGIQAIQLAKLAGCEPIIVSASKTHEEYLKLLGADFVLDYQDPDIEAQIRDCIPVGKSLKQAFDCAGAEPAVFKSVVEPGGSIVLVLATRGEWPDHRIERAIGGYIHMLGRFDAATFSFKQGTEKEERAGRIAREVLAWTMKELGKDVGVRKYQPPRVRRLSGKGLYDVMEAIELMKRNEIHGEKVVYWMDETPELRTTRK